jgi:AcrR family transcriptional regulator
VVDLSQPVRRAYRSGRREAQARLTRRRVVQAAAAVFLECGWSGATVRAVAAAAEVSVPTVEALFRTKAGLLKAAIDVAIAGDDEPVSVLARPWAAAARQAATAPEFLSIVGEVIAAAQARSAGLVLAVFEGAARDPGLAELAGQMIAQRAVTAGWIADGLFRLAPRRPGGSREEAVDTVWVLMDPAVFDRLMRRPGWTLQRYGRWFATSVQRLLSPDVRPSPPASTDDEGGTYR